MDNKYFATIQTCFPIHREKHKTAKKRRAQRGEISGGSKRQNMVNDGTCLADPLSCGAMHPSMADTVSIPVSVQGAIALPTTITTSQAAAVAFRQESTTNQNAEGSQSMDEAQLNDFMDILGVTPTEGEAEEANSYMNGNSSIVYSNHFSQ